MIATRGGIALAVVLAGCGLDPCYGVRCAPPEASVIVRAAMPLDSVTATTDGLTFSCADESAGFTGTVWVCRADSAPVVGTYQVTVVADDRTEVVALEVTSFAGCCGEVAQGSVVLDLDGDGGA